MQSSARSQTSGIGAHENLTVAIGFTAGTFVQVPADHTPSDNSYQDGGNLFGGSNPFDLGQESARLLSAYGSSRLGRSCLLARRLVESGTRVVTINMFDSVFDQVTWDCHGAGPFSGLDDYKRVLLPTFDQAFSALLDDLGDRGLLETTMVAAVGEFGRTPRINSSGGRDHWPGVWSVALAGGGVRGGQVIGASDARASEPVDRPVSPQELLASFYQGMDIDPSPLVDAPPVFELFS